MSIGMHGVPPTEAIQKPSATGHKYCRRHTPRATFIVTTPGDRGKHNRGHISAINANSALLRHARTRLLNEKVVIDEDIPRARKLRNERSPTADSGYQSDYSISPKIDQQIESQRNSSLSRQPPCSQVTRRGGDAIQESDRVEGDSSFSFPDPYQSTLDRILQSTLDPFVRLPINLSGYERSLLHFYLTDARTLVFGTSPRPKYDVAVYCAELLIEHSVLFNVTKIASAEAILCKATGKELSPMFYALRARVYSMMNQMLDSTETTFFDKVDGFHQLGVMEMYLNHPVEQKQHLQAMWRYIEAHGGCSHFLSSASPPKGTLGIGIYSANLVYIDIPVPSKIDLSMLMARFVSSLRRARMWYQLQWLCLQQHKQMKASPQVSRKEALNLRIYLEWLIDEYLKKQETPQHLSKGAYHSIYNLFITPMVFDYDLDDSRTFLRQIEACMQQRGAAQSELGEFSDLVPISHFLQGIHCLLSYVRTLLPNVRHEAEVDLCESSMDALKVFPLLSRSSILRLARDMIRCLLMPVIDNNHIANSFDEDYLHDLTWEAEETWGSKFCVD